MKNATSLPLEVKDELRAAAESVLQEGETMSSFVEDSVRLSVEHRKAQREFIERGLAARKEGKQCGQCVSSGKMLKRLDMSLGKGRASRRGIALSTLDFEGELTVSAPEIFLPALFNGIGPAKSFGCGLLLVRRI